MCLAVTTINGSRDVASSSQPQTSRALKYLTLAIFAIALLLRVMVALHFPSIEKPDEIFNSLEPAHRLAYGYGVVVWEWREGVRSWVFPAFLAGIMRATAWMGAGSSGYLAAIVVILSLLSLSCVWFAYAWGKRSGGTTAAVIAAGACATWYQLVYFAPKAFNEVVATDFLLPGLYLGMYGGRLPEKKRLFFAGVCLGIAVALRLQLAPAVAFAVLYFCRERWATRAPVLVLGILLPFVAFGLVDGFTWSYPFHSYLRYLQIVLFQGRHSRYGAEPWYFYVTLLWKSLWPMLLLALAAIRRNALLAWIVVIIVASHSVLGHKEFRFVYPVLPLIVTLAALGLVEIFSALNARVRSPLPARAVIASGLVLCAIVSGCFARWDFRWGQGAGGLIALDRLSKDSSLCGVGLAELPWDLTGGYVHLHRDVPILLVNPHYSLGAQMLNFNALVTMGPLNSAEMGFSQEGCWKGVCLYRRSGPCFTSPPFYEVNKMLRLSDQ